ncbi:hypothetical protein [Diplocloster modestus]|uniref:Uncharacterized protein n=1 Tax=Diplocloster modestus TaxID=2850322 RepID=A0ABS6KCM9_9FIRM|nr:hypothetical protein [Diplocloster modestus]MBU9728268.1 hypothetical protein [Diplocloster modestus]
MENCISFKNKKVTHIDFELYDGKVIKVGTPSKYTYDIMENMDKKLKTCTVSNRDTIDDLYELAALILSNNLAREEITVDYVSKQLDFDDLIILYNAYRDFVIQVKTNPN